MNNNKQKTSLPSNSNPSASRGFKPMRGGGMRGGMISVEKAKDFKGSIKQLYYYIKPFSFIIIVSIICAIAGVASSILAPNVLKLINEEILKGLYIPSGSINLKRITEIGIWLLFIYGASFLLNFLQGFLMAGVSGKVTRRFRNEIFSKINRVPLKYFDTNSYGDTLSRITNDVDTVSQTLNQSLNNLITSITMVVGALLMMFINSWQLTLVTLIISPISFILVMLIVKFSQRFFKQQQAYLGEINGKIEEDYSGHSIIKVFNKKQASIEEFDEVNEKLFSSSYKAQFISGLMHPLMTFLGNLSYVFIFIIGGAISIENPLFAATIIAFITFVRMFNNNLSQISVVANTLQSTAAASERIFEFLNEEEQEDESSKIKKLKFVKGNVEFKNINFGYKKNKQIIYDFNAKIKSGQKIAIVGPTGAGKTTIVNLLMRFYETNSGDITIDGVPIKEMKRENVRALFGMVLQDTWLFEGTIRENIRFGNFDTSDLEIEEACKSANIHHLISTFPNGYDMVLDEHSNLSQGEKQLLTIARAMVQNPPMLILDEATSSVDTRTELHIQEAMDKLMKGRTSFVIAHRLSTIKNADLILVMRKGNIIEIGKHEELMKVGGFYSNLYNSQFSKNYVPEEIVETNPSLT